ncbi:MAG: hypothetical protein IKP86_10110 [Anaerolineaceae bacterium]|nr:hypothetical protein [Anaerolineaceae bacterium]
MKASVIGDKTVFAISYEFFDGSHETELSMFVAGRNILEFNRNGEVLTTRWDLDDLALWLRNFIDHMKVDPYPLDAAGDHAAMKDINARQFDSDDEEEFDAYYDKLDEWNLRHRWHTASNGAVLADVYFELTGQDVEISWNNQDFDDNIKFRYGSGGASVETDFFVMVVEQFLSAYAMHWFH